MNTQKDSFDSMMRKAFGSMGTSMSFTRRLMVRIEKEKEMARVARTHRILSITAVTFCIIMLGILTAAIMLAWDAAPQYLINIRNTAVTFLQNIKESYHNAYLPYYPVGGLTVFLGVMAFMVLDRTLKKEYK